MSSIVAEKMNRMAATGTMTAATTTYVETEEEGMEGEEVVVCKVGAENV